MNIYDFYKVKPKEGVSLSELVQKHFYKLVGRIYKSHNEEDMLWLALEQKNETTRSQEYINIDDIKNALKNDAVVSEKLKIDKSRSEYCFAEPEWPMIKVDYLSLQTSEP